LNQSLILKYGQIKSKKEQVKMNIFKKTVYEPVQTIPIDQAVRELSRHHNHPEGIKRELQEGGLKGTPCSLYTTNREFLEERQ